MLYILQLIFVDLYSSIRDAYSFIGAGSNNMTIWYSCVINVYDTG